MNKLIFAAMLSLFTVAACPGPGPLPVVGGTVVDCLGQNRPQIDATINELKTLFTNGHVEWSLVYERAKTAGRDIGGCVIAELVQYYLGGFGGPIDNGNAWEGHEALEKFRTEEAGGASFKSMCKKTDGTEEVCKL